MKYIPILPSSLLNLALNITAMIAASILPHKETKIFSAGHIEQDSCSLMMVQYTCKDGYQLFIQHCDFTNTYASNPETATTGFTSHCGSSESVDVTTGRINTGTIPTIPNASLWWTWVSAIHL